MKITNGVRWGKLLGCFALGLMAGCINHPLGLPEEGKHVEAIQFFPQSLEKDIDILFVIDNSDSMREEQEDLANRFEQLIEALRTPKLDNRIPNIRIGVVSSDLGAGSYALDQVGCRAGGDGARLQTQPRVPGCVPPDKPWIEYTYINGQEKTNIPSNEPDKIKQVVEAFKCIAQLGIDGCGFEQQLEAARRALDSDLKINPGFLRENALLAVVFLTDEDDCSAKNPQLFDPSSQSVSDPMGLLDSFRCTEFGLKCDTPWDRKVAATYQNCTPGGTYLFPVEDYISFFKQIKPLNRTLLFAIGGPMGEIQTGYNDQNRFHLKPTCWTGKGKAVPALRLKAVVEGMGKNGYYNQGTDTSLTQKEEVNICSDNFGPAMRLLGRMIVASLGNQCLNGPPVSRAGNLVCQQGDDLGQGKTCPEHCLEKTECVVTEMEDMGSGAKTSIKQCPKEKFDNPADTSCGDSCPCWRIVKKKECKANVDGSPYGLEILRQGEAPKGAVAEVKCATAPYPWGKNPAIKVCQ